MPITKFCREISPDWRGLVDCIMRKREPDRVHFIELFLDAEMQEAICEKFDLLEGLDTNDQYFNYKRQIKIQSFLGYDFVRCGLDDFGMPLKHLVAEDSAGLKRKDGRAYIEEHRGPITTWDEFEAYPWPDPDKASTRSLEWYSENLPENMCVIGSGGFAHFCEYVCWLMGYETLCYALFEQRDLVDAIARRLEEIYVKAIDRLLAFDRVKIIWGSDDMGFKSGTLISPDDLREFVLPGHRIMAELSHKAGRPYLLHACGKLDAIMPDLVDDVKIDAKHSFEDTIEFVTDVKREWGDRIALLGGIDLDFLCRSSEEQIRRRVRETLEVCMPGGGYCLGTGNSVANYIPVDNYLTMMDEGRKFGM